MGLGGFCRRKAKVMHILSSSFKGNVPVPNFLPLSAF